MAPSEVLCLAICRKAVSWKTWILNQTKTEIWNQNLNRLPPFDSCRQTIAFNPKLKALILLPYILIAIQLLIYINIIMFNVTGRPSSVGILDIGHAQSLAACSWWKHSGSTETFGLVWPPPSRPGHTNAPPAVDPTDLGWRLGWPLFPTFYRILEVRCLFEPESDADKGLDIYFWKFWKFEIAPPKKAKK